MVDGRRGGPESEHDEVGGGYNPLFDSSDERVAPPRLESAFQPGGGYNSLFDSSDERVAPPGPGPAPAAPARRSRTSRFFAVLALVSVVVIGLVAVGLYVSVQRLSSNIPRVPHVFDAVDRTERPSVLDDRVSFLLMGTDSQQAVGRRDDDVMMLARVDVNLDPDDTNASVVSIPRDSWVTIPDRGPGTISAAYGLGGAALLVQTVEKLTNVRIDHFAIIDFAGFQAMIDAVGGIDVRRSAAPTNRDGIQYVEQVTHLDGPAALAYVSEGTNDPAGYAGRIARQQYALRALLDKAASGGLLADPVKFFRLLDALSHSVSVDETLTNDKLQGLGLQMRGLRTSGVQFVVSPVQSVGREGGQSVIYLDEARSAELWNAVRNDTVGEYVKQHPDQVLKAPR